LFVCWDGACMPQMLHRTCYIARTSSVGVLKRIPGGAQL